MQRLAALTGLDHCSLAPALGTAAVTSFLAIVACVSYPAIIFSGELEPLLPYGIGVFFLSATLIGGTVALTSSYQGSLGYAQSEPAVIVGLIAASMAAILRSEGQPELILPTVLAVILTGAIGCGLFFVFLGSFRLGNLIRFIPFPVMGGFLAGIGWLLGLAALSSMAGVRLKPANAMELLSAGMAVKWLPGVAAGTLLWALQTWRRHAGNLPLVLGGTLLLFWIAVGLGDAKAVGIEPVFPSAGAQRFKIPVALLGMTGERAVVHVEPRRGISFDVEAARESGRHPSSDVALERQGSAHLEQFAARLQTDLFGEFEVDRRGFEHPPVHVTSAFAAHHVEGGLEHRRTDGRHVVAVVGMHDEVEAPTVVAT